jgi:hypothetical protein
VRVSRRLAVGAVLLLALLPACGGTDRPEGVVERWLISLNQGVAGRPGRYAPSEISNQILPGWQGCDPGALDLTEVGRGVRVANSGPGPANPGSTEAVPYRVVFASSIDSLCGHTVRPTGLLLGVANLSRSSGEWRLVSVYPQPPGRVFRVPSQGGQRVGGATAGEWLAGIGIGIGLALLVVGLMKLAPKPAPLPRGK